MKESFKGLSSTPIEKIENFNDTFVKQFKKNERIPILINANGIGNLYYTVSMKYALPPIEQNPRDEGICVYEEIYDTETNEIITTNNLSSEKIYSNYIKVL